MHALPFLTLSLSLRRHSLLQGLGTRAHVEERQMLTNGGSHLVDLNLFAGKRVRKTQPAYLSPAKRELSSRLSATGQMQIEMPH